MTAQDSEAAESYASDDLDTETMTYNGIEDRQVRTANVERANAERA